MLSALGAEQTPWLPVAEQWPQDSLTQAEFELLLALLRTGVQQALQAADDPALAPRSGTLSAEAGRDLETLVDLAVHNAYHWGQVVLMRRLLGDWPPTAN